MEGCKDKAMVKHNSFRSSEFGEFCPCDSYSPQAATKKQKYEKISEKKMSTPVEVLCKVSVH